MSWARDEWKEELSAQALKKVSEYEQSLERNCKELQQRQFQLDSFNAVLQKQKILTEEQKNVGNEYKRELQLVSEKCDEYEKMRGRIMADMLVKDSRINSLDALLIKEKQALECEIGKCNRFKMDLETNIAKYNNLLSDFNKLQKDVQVQHRKASSYEDQNISCPSASDSEPEKEVFPLNRETPRKPTQQNIEIIPLKARTSSSTSSEEMGQTFQTPSQEGKVRELQRTMESVKKEKRIINDKWQKSVHDLDICQSKLAAMEVKQKQLVQEIECSRHNVEAGRRHQEERMKEKEREYRQEISTQTKALIQLEQEVKEAKIKLDQEQKHSDVKMKEFEASTKKLQKEVVTAKEAIERLELEKNEQIGVVERCENTVAELRKELTSIEQNKDISMKTQEENMKTIQNLNQQLETYSHELEERKKMVLNLEESIEPLLAEERRKYMELVRTREEERNSAVVKLNELEKSLEDSTISNSEKQNLMSKQVEELTSQIEKTAALLQQKEEQVLLSKISLEGKNKEIEKMSVLLDTCSNSEELKKVSEEKVLVEGKLESAQKLCESLKQNVKECEIEVSQIDAQRQMLQMDMEDKDQLIVMLEQQKASLEFGVQENLQKISKQKENTRLINEELDSLKSENEVLKNRMKERESNEKQIQNELSETRSSLEIALSCKTALTEELRKTSEERDKSCGEYETRTTELERTLNELKYTQNISEQNELIELKNKLKTAENILEEKDRELCDVNVGYKTLEEEYNTTLVKLEKVSESLECMKANVNSLGSEKSNLLSTLEKLEEERDNQSRVLSEMEATTLEKDRLICSLRNIKDEILEKKNAEFLSVEAKLRELSDKCLDKSHQLTQEVEKVRELGAERDMLKERVETVCAELLKKDHERQKYVDQCQELERSSLEYKMASEQLESELATTKEVNEATKTRLDEDFAKLKEELSCEKEKMSTVSKELEKTLSCILSLNTEKESLETELKNTKLEGKTVSDKFKNLNLENKIFVQKLASSEQQKSDYEKEIERLQKELDNVNSMVESTKTTFEKDMRNLRFELIEGKEKLELTKIELQEKETEFVSLKSTQESLEFEIENIESEKQAILKKYEMSFEDAKILTEKLTASEEQIGKYKIAREQMEGEFMDMKGGAESTQMKLNEDLRNVRDSLKNEKEKLETAREDVKQKEVALQSVEAEKEVLEFQIENMNSENISFSEKLNKILNENNVVGEQLAASQREVSELKIMVEQLQQEIDTAQTVVENTQMKSGEDIKHLRSELSEEKTRMEMARKNLEEKDTTIQTINTEKESLVFEIENMKTEKQVSVEKFERTLNENKISLEKLVVSEQQINDYKLSIEQLQRELTEARTEIETSQTTLDGHLTSLRSELAEEKASLEMTRNELKGKDTVIQMMDAEKDSLLFEIENMKAEKKISCEKLERSLSEDKIFLEKLSGREQQIIDYKIIVEQLQGDLNEAKYGTEAKQVTYDDSMRNLQNELIKEKTKLETITYELSEKEVAIQVMINEKESLLFEVENMKTEKQFSVEKFEQAMNKNKISLQELAAGQQEINDYKLKMEQLKQELAYAKETMESRQTMFDGDIRNLRNELTGEREKLEKASKKLVDSETLISAVKTKKESLEFEIEQLKSKNEALGEKLEMTKQQCSSYEDRLVESDKLAGDYKAKDSDIKDLKEQLCGKVEELNQNKAQYEDMKAKNNEAIAGLKATLENKESLLRERSYELEQTKMIVETQSGKLTETELERKREGERNERRIAELEREIDNLRKCNEVKTKERQDAMELVESLKSQLEKNNAAALLTDRECERERELFLKQIANAAKDIEEINNNLHHKEEMIRSLEKRLVENTTEKDQERHQAVLAAKEEREKLVEKIRQCKTENEDLKTEMKSSKQNLESRIIEKNGRILQMESSLNRVEAERQKVEMENRKNLEKVRSLEGELTRESEKVESTCKRIDELLSSKREEHDAMLSAERDFGKVRGELEGEIKILREKLGNREESLEEYRQSNHQLEEVQRDCDKTKEDLDKSKETIISLQDSLKEINLERDRLSYELRNNLDNHKVLVNSIDEDKAGLENEINNYKNTIEQMQNKLDNQIRKIEDGEQLFKQKDEELFVADKELESKISDVQRLEKVYETSQELELELRHHLGVVTNELEKYKSEQVDTSEELIVAANEKIKELEENLVERNSKLEEEREEIVAKTKEFVLKREKEYSEKNMYLEGELNKKEQLLVTKCEENCQLLHRLETEQKSKECLMTEFEERLNEMEAQREMMGKGPVTPPGRMKVLESDLDEERKLTKRLQEKCVVLDELVLKEQKSRIALQKKVKRLQEEIPNLEGKDDKISALESEVGLASQHLGSVKSELEAEKMNNGVLEKEVVKLKEKEVNLEKRLEQEIQTNDMLRRDYEQLKQKESSPDLNKSEGLVMTHDKQSDSMKVSELECYIDGLEKEMVEQRENVLVGEKSLKRALESKDIVQRSLDEELKEKEGLQELLNEKLQFIKSLEERIAKMEQHLAERESENEMSMSGFKTEMESLKEVEATQQESIRQLEEKTKQLDVLLHEKTTNLASNEETRKELGTELEKIKELANTKSNCVDELKHELKQAKCSLKMANEDLEKGKAKAEFLETMKEEVLKVEEKCASLRGSCAEYENKLDEERHGFNKERKVLEDKVSSYSKCYQDAKKKLKELEVENKPMMERLFELEGQIVMMPQVESLQEELERLKKELNEEKENGKKHEKLSAEYLKKLNEFNSGKNHTPAVGIPKGLSKDKEVYEELTTNQRNGHVSKNKQNHTLTSLSPPEEQAMKEKQSLEATKRTPILMEETEGIFLSPITRSISNLSFSSPAQQKPAVKKTTLLAKPTATTTSRIQKPKVTTITSNLPADKKRKEEGVDKDAVPKPKRVKLSSVSSDLQGVRSPFVLNRNRDKQTRSKTSCSRLVPPSTRTQRSRIPKRTGASGRGETTGKGIAKLGKTQPSSDECKMQ